MRASCVKNGEKKREREIYRESKSIFSILSMEFFWGFSCTRKWKQKNKWITNEAIFSHKSGTTSISVNFTLLKTYKYYTPFHDVCSIHLLLTLSFSMDARRLSSLKIKTLVSHCFFFPFSIKWMWIYAFSLCHSLSLLNFYY